MNRRRDLRRVPLKEHFATTGHRHDLGDRSRLQAKVHDRIFPHADFYTCDFGRLEPLSFYPYIIFSGWDSWDRVDPLARGRSPMLDARRDVLRHDRGSGHDGPGHIHDDATETSRRRLSRDRSRQIRQKDGPEDQTG